MVKMNIQYQGDLHCELTHGPSQTRISTDAPTDNQGRGEAFSPTDLVGAALGSCILTTMAIVAKRDNIDFTKAKATVEKSMQDKPRRIAELSVQIELPKELDENQRRKFEHVATHCPVHGSLHPDVKIPLKFTYV